MRPLSARERLLISVALVVVVAFLYGVGVALPVRRRGAKLAGEERSLSRKVALAAEMYLEAPTLVQETAALRGEFQQVIFPEQDVGVGAMRKLDQLASELQVRVASVRPAEAEPLGSCLRYPMTVTVECDFPQLVRLLYELERPGRRLWVEGVEISRSRQEADKLQANVSLAVYAKTKEGEPVPSGGRGGG